MVVLWIAVSLLAVDGASPYDDVMDDLFEQNALYGLQHAALGVVVLDANYRVCAMSPVAEAMLQRSADQLLGRSVGDLHPHSGAGRIIAMLESVRQGASGSAASLIIPVPGRLLLLKIASLSASAEGIGAAFVLTLLDAMEVSLRGQPNGGVVRASGTGGDFAQGHRPAEGGEGRSKPHPYLVKLPVETSQGIILLDLDEVVCLTASGRYAEVKTRQGRPRLSGLSLKDLEDRLNPDRFLRVHRAHMVNVVYAEAFRRRGENCELVMADDVGTVVPIGRSRVSLVRGLLGL